MQWAINHISMSKAISQRSIKPLRFQLWQQSILSFRPFSVCQLTAGRVTSICPTAGIQLTSTMASDRCPSLTYKATKKKKVKSLICGRHKVDSFANPEWREPNWFFSPSVSFYLKNQRIFTILSLLYWNCVFVLRTRQRDLLPSVEEDLHWYFFGYLIEKL